MYITAGTVNPREIQARFKEILTDRLKPLLGHVEPTEEGCGLRSRCPACGRKATGPNPLRRETIREWMAGRTARTFSRADMMAAFDIDTNNAGSLIHRLTEHGAIERVSRGHYRITQKETI